ncbi:MAG TPA: hypothetical protein VMI54_18060 [Polyangiaceae bacterium]|nr:hypothetical protein [Polyangiaceae bacterium]
MRRSRAPRLLTALGSLVFGLALAEYSAAAEPSACGTAAPVSPCFDADPLWVPSGPSPFAALPSAHVLEARALSLVLAAGMSHRPVVFETPSPHPAGQEIEVVSATSTLTLGARYGLGRGVDAGVALPFVPYQTGAGTESVTSQDGGPLTHVALRDPRLELAATLLGRQPRAPFVLGTHLGVALPFGTETALAGAAGPTVAPGLSALVELEPLTLGVDLGARLTRAVTLAGVREGSAFTAALGLSLRILREPELALGAEAWIAPHLVSRPAVAPSGTLDLPAEWLGTLRLAPGATWSFLVAGGSGLPLSHALDPSGARVTTLAVTSPDVRVLALARCTLPALF